MEASLCELITAAQTIGDQAEVEIRLGHIVSDRFRACVSPGDWNKVLNRLRTNSKWTRVECQRFTDEYYADGCRKRIHADGVSCCKKQRVRAIDLRDERVDVRLCLSEETPFTLPCNGKPPSRRLFKTRHRFVHKDLWSFELTEVTHERPPDMDCETLVEYQIEIELLQTRPTKGAKYAADYGALLVRDLMRMLHT